MRQVFWVTLTTAILFSATGRAQVVGPSAPVPTTPSEIWKHPGLMAVPIGSKFCYVDGHLTPAQGKCPTPAGGQVCLVGTERCSDLVKPGAGGVTPL